MYQNYEQADAGIEFILKKYPRIAALIEGGRYPVTPEGRLLVEPTPREAIHTLYSVSVNAPVPVWDGEEPRMVWCEVLAFRKTPLMPISEGLDESMHCPEYPINEGQFETLLTADELPAVEAFLLDTWEGAETVCFRAHPVPVNTSLPINYALSWGGNLRMKRLAHEVLFDLGQMELAVYYDARDYPPRKDEKPVKPVLRLVESTDSAGDDSEELPF